MGVIQSRFIAPAVGYGTLALATVLAFLTGRTLDETVRFKLPAAPQIAEESADDTSDDTDAADYEVIKKRNLFGAKAKATPPPAPKASTLRLRLVGTKTGGPGQPFAIIEEMGKGEQDIFGINETLFSQARLVEIHPDSVRIDRSGTIETLVLEDGPPGVVPGRAPVPAQDSANQTEFTLPESEVTQALANLPMLLSQARAVPYFRNGKSIGMRLFAIRSGSLYEKIGLKNGDIIKSVNSNSLSDPTQALRIFEQLKSERDLTVSVERAGQDVDLRYKIE